MSDITKNPIYVQAVTLTNVACAAALLIEKVRDRIPATEPEAHSLLTALDGFLAQVDFAGMKGLLHSLRGNLQSLAPGVDFIARGVRVDIDKANQQVVIFAQIAAEKRVVIQLPKESAESVEKELASCLDTLFPHRIKGVPKLLLN